MPGAEPGEYLGLVARLLGGDAGGGFVDRDRFAVRFEQQGGRVRGVQVVVEDAPPGRPPLGFRIVLPEQLGGVGAQQVVERVPARRVPGQQVRAGQLGECDLRSTGRSTGQARRGRGGHLRPRMQ